MEMTLAELAALIGASTSGDDTKTVTHLSEPEHADTRSLCYAQSAAMRQTVLDSVAAGFIVGEDFPDLTGVSLLRSDQPRRAFIRALELFVPPGPGPGVHASAVVHPGARLDPEVGVGPCAVIGADARIGPRSRVGAGCYIGQGVRIGADCLLHPNVSVLDGSRVGDRCILHAGAVLGADGYGYEWISDHHHKIPQLGVVVVEDDVEIGANTCIDRATLGATRVGSGTKLDNLVHVAHNCQVGRHVLLTGQVGVAGSTRLGDGVVAGGQAGISDHVDVAAGVQIGAKAAVMSDVGEGGQVLGIPARPLRRVLREQAAAGKLPELLKTVRRQQEQLTAMQDRIRALEERSE